MLALQGVLELVRNHNISYPDMYDRLYAMFEPEMFVTRYKRRLVHIADVFLSSTYVLQGLTRSLYLKLLKNVKKLMKTDFIIISSSSTTWMQCSYLLTYLSEDLILRALTRKEP